MQKNENLSFVTDEMFFLQRLDVRCQNYPLTNTYIPVPVQEDAEQIFIYTMIYLNLLLSRVVDAMHMVQASISCVIIFCLLFALSCAATSKAWKQQQAPHPLENEHTKHVKESSIYMPTTICFMPALCCTKLLAQDLLRKLPSKFTIEPN